jgi:vacuolar-type H+-ATPase subunit C/Vma6
MSNYAYAATRARARRARLLPPEAFGQLLNMEPELIAQFPRIWATT